MRLPHWSELVHSLGESLNNVLAELQLNEFQNVKRLRFYDCDSVTHLLNRTHEVIKFPNLYGLELQSLKCLTHFCSDNVEGIQFPRVRKMYFIRLPEFQNFCPTANIISFLSQPRRAKYHIRWQHKCSMLSPTSN